MLVCGVWIDGAVLRDVGQRCRSMPRGLTVRCSGMGFNGGVVSCGLTVRYHVLWINGEMSGPSDLCCGAAAHGLTMPWRMDSRCSDVACGLAVPRHVGSRCSDMSCGLLLRRCAYWGLLCAGAEVCRLLRVLAMSGLLHVHASVLAT